MTSRRTWAAVAVALAGCGSVPLAAGAGASLSPVRYELAVDPGLGRLTETVCSEGPWTDRVVSVHPEARVRLLSARRVRADGAEEPIDVGARGALAIPTRALSPSDCLRLVLDVASPGGGMNGCLHSRGLVACATSAFLVAAEPWQPTARHRVTVSLPRGMAVSPIFGEDERGLYLDERSFRYVGYAAFGELEVRALEVPGGCARVVVPRGTSLAESSHLGPWVARASLASAMITGSAMAHDVAITAVPAPGSDAMPVLFGMAGRGTRPSVLAFVEATPTRGLETDWTLVHELAHLAVPYVPSEDAWLSEGLATYQQEVLRARAGMQSPEDAWRAIDAGLARGARDGTGATLREESRNMHASRAYARVYWGGAAIALLVDVALRTEAESTLDARLARLRGRRDTRMDAAALLEAIDDERALVRAIAARWLEDPAFPDTAAAYALLGLSHDRGGHLVFAESALREEIMNPVGPLSSNGPCRQAIGAPDTRGFE
ncbi:MAG: hypothetical protein ACK5U8_26070 [Deltaproteobacteria bacterium]